MTGVVEYVGKRDRQAHIHIPQLHRLFVHMLIERLRLSIAGNTNTQIVHTYEVDAPTFNFFR